MMIGLSGYGRAGKDTIGDVLVRYCGYERFAFADPLKRLGADLLGVPLNWFYDAQLKFAPMEGWGTLTPVEVALKLGTEVGRHIHPDVWVRKTMSAIGRTPSVVITDLRFPNEAKAIKDAGGICVRVKRDGVGPRIDPKTGEPHLSDIALDGYIFDLYFDNDSDLADLTDGSIEMERFLRAQLKDVG